VPYKAKFPVADRAALRRAVTKILGTAKHLPPPLRLGSIVMWLASDLAVASGGLHPARPIDSETKRRKQGAQSYASKCSISKRVREAYTEVYDVFFLLGGLAKKSRREGGCAKPPAAAAAWQKHAAEPLVAHWNEPASVSTKPRFSCPKPEVRLERRGSVLMICLPKELAAARSGCNRVPDFPFKMR
jgi:hypothetical protein